MDELPCCGDREGVVTNEQSFYLTLKRIAAYMDPETLLRKGETMYGVSGEEAVAMAYENVLEEARSAVRGKRMPKDPK